MDWVTERGADASAVCASPVILDLSFSNHQIVICSRCLFSQGEPVTKEMVYWLLLFFFSTSMSIDCVLKTSVQKACWKSLNIKCSVFQSGAKINISDASCPERIVTVTGTTDQIFKAFTMICKKFEEVNITKICLSTTSVRKQVHNFVCVFVFT